jgi:hypothetical protein
LIYNKQEGGHCPPYKAYLIMTTKITPSELEYWQKQWPQNEDTDAAFEMILSRRWGSRNSF